MTTRRSRFHSVFFPRSAADPGRVAPRPVDGSTVYFLLKQGAGIGPRYLPRALASDVAKWRADNKGAAASRTFLFYDATRRGLEVVPFAAGRAHPGLRLTSTLAGVPVPPKFSGHLRPYYDAMIECHFEDGLTDENLDALEGLRARLARSGAQLSTCECDRRYVVLDNPATGPDSVFLTVITRVPWNQERASAQRYWIDEHAQIVVDNLDRTNMKGYEQAHTTLDEGSQFDNEFNGVATIEFNRMRDYLTQLLRPRSMMFNNTLVLDEMNLTVNSEISLFRRREIR